MVVWWCMGIRGGCGWICGRDVGEKGVMWWYGCGRKEESVGLGRSGEGRGRGDRNGDGVGLAVNQLGAEGGRSVAEALKANTILTRLSLFGEYGGRGRAGAVVVWWCGGVVVYGHAGGMQL